MKTTTRQPQHFCIILEGSTLCFYHSGDYDWYPEVSNWTEHHTGTATCNECRRAIGDGEWRRELYAQQYEEPQNGEYNEETGECVVPEGEEWDYGETWTYTRCAQCDKVLEVIKKVEEEAGCKGAETQPELSLLRESLAYSDDTEQYLTRIRAEHPELTEHLKLLGAGK